MTAKRGRGRPKLHTEAVVRSQVSLPKSTDKKLRKAGSGSLSAGIVAAGYRLPDPKKAPKDQFVDCTDRPDIIEACENGTTLESPRGGWWQGRYLVYAHSLKQWRGQPVEFDPTTA